MPTAGSKPNQEDALKRRHKRKAKTPEPVAEPVAEPDEEKIVKTEESDNDDTVLSDRPDTESNASDMEVSRKEIHDTEVKPSKRTVTSPAPVKEESQDSDRTESEEDEL